MKKHVFSLGLMLVSALAFTNCAKQEVINDTPEQPAGVPFELTAGMDTKTEATDAGVITWKTGDALAVFHAEAGSTTYSKNDKFTFDSGSSFKGELQDGALTADAYDWYALYPYYSTIPSPANTTKGYTTFAASQTQTGNNSMAHLCGSNVPMYGKATGVAKDTKPTITMNQAASIIKVHVTNTLDAPLTVTSVELSAPQKIAGNYFINFSGSEPSFTESGTTGKTAVTLSVTSGEAIAKDNAADFFVVIKPFAQTEAGVLTVSVNGYEKQFNIPAATEFKPGKIKTVNFAYDYVSIAEPTSKTGWYRVEDASWLKAGDRVLIAANGSDFAMSTTQNTNNRVHVAVTKSTDGVYSTLTAGDDVQVFILEEGTVANSFAFKADNGVTADGYIYAASSSANHLKTQDTKDGNASFKIAVDTEGNASVVAQGTYTHNVMQYNQSSSIFACYGSASQSAVAIYKYYGTYVVAPVISVTSANPMNVSKDGEVATISYSIANPIGESISAVSNQDWVNTFDFSTDGEISFIVDAQAPGADARSAEITLSYDGADDVVVTVNQAGAEKSSYTITWNATNNSKGISSYTDSWAVTADGLTCNMNNFNNNNNGWNLVKCGSKKAATVATIITASAIPEAIKTVTITIDAITAESINSIKLYVSDSSSFGSTEAGTFTADEGDQSVVIASPANNKYYKIEVDCKKGSSNGLLTLSKLVFAK